MAQPNPITQAIKQICEEKNISYEAVVQTIEAALAVAYKKDFVEKGENLNVKVEFNPETAAALVFDVKTVVTDEFVAEALKAQEEARLAAEAAAEGNSQLSAASDQQPKADASSQLPAAENRQPEAETREPAAAGAPMEVAAAEEEKERYDPKSMIALSEARKLKPDVKLGDEIRTELFPPTAYGRMAAQTAKQVIIQRLREAERQTIYDTYKGRERTLLNGIIQRVEGRLVLVDLGQATAIMPPGDQIEREYYRPGTRMKFYVVSVSLTPKGPEIVISRSHPEMVRKLFEIEVPEVASAAVEIKAIAREAGSRTKIAVFSHQKNIDPVGSCVGQRGTRVQTVIGELGGEKIDIIEWSDDPVKYITNALSPAKVLSLKLDHENRVATVEVKEDQVSLAIGRAGQNVRLAAKLTGWKIDIVGEEGTVRPSPDSPVGKAAAAAEGNSQPPAPRPTETTEPTAAEKPPADSTEPSSTDAPPGQPSA